ncbi:hypothetical protein BDN67DRAFT_973854 [Paxillus ammoniavirescens]|nr:hypothetical protein BDN67DRAFT_973854 [Paxillus ammoniavirescens]
MSRSESPQDVYARLMTRVDPSRGYPLWFPEPESRLPEDYRNDGLRIGDVGIVAEDGSFDVFFNICLPADHPLHQPHGVPKNFHQVFLSDRDLRQFPSADGVGRVVSTRSISHRAITAGVAGNAIVSTAGIGLNYEFSSSSEEGAILVLPEGAGKTDLANKLVFRSEALEHALSWYEFAYFNLGRSTIDNDSLYLITGYHKASSWSVAAFSDAGGGTSLTANFTAGEVVNGNIGGAYSWQVTNSMHWRVGPEEGHNRNRRNQAVSIRGYKIAVREGTFASLLGLGGRIKVSSTLPSTKLALRRPFFPRATSSRSGNQGSGELPLQSSQRPLGLHWTDALLPSSPEPPPVRGFEPFPMSSKGFRSFRVPPTLERMSAPTTTTTSEPADDSEAELQTVSVQPSPPSQKVFHPSDVINRFLLGRVPRANIAITHDSEWVGVVDHESMFEEDYEVEILARAVARFSITHGSGFVYLLERAWRPSQEQEKAAPTSPSRENALHPKDPWTRADSDIDEDEAGYAPAESSTDISTVVERLLRRGAYWSAGSFPPLLEKSSRSASLLGCGGLGKISEW